MHGTTGLGLGVLIGAGVAASTWLAGRLPFMASMEQAFRDLLGELSLPTILGLAVASACAEELLFRGILQPWWGFWPTCVAFALVHLPHDRALWPWPFFAFVTGALFGGLTIWTGDLGAAIGAHFAINLLNLHRLVGPRSAA